MAAAAYSNSSVLSLNTKAATRRRLTSSTHSRSVVCATFPSAKSVVFTLTSTKPLVARVLTEEGSQIQVDDSTTTGGGGSDFGDKGGGGGGGGGGGDSNNNNNDNEEEENNKKKKMSMSMSQKLTLGYAALVGGNAKFVWEELQQWRQARVGGVMGYVKSGSQKSLAAGGLSSLLLYYVYTQLPVRPAFASSLGFGLSAALLVVMGSRFKKSGKIFPAGVVSFISLVMTGGYFHGIMRGMH